MNGRAFKTDEWSDRGRMIIRIQDLTGTGTDPNHFEGEVEARYLVRPGDLLISWAATLGVYVWSGPEAVLNQHIFKVQSDIDRRFHFYLVQMVLGELRQQAHGSGMVHITKGRFASTPVLVPPLREQTRIVAALEEQFTRLEAAVAALERTRVNLKRYRGSVLKAAVEGRLVPTEAELARREGRTYGSGDGFVARRAESRRRATPSDERDTGIDESLPPLPPGWTWKLLADIGAVTGGLTKNRARDRLPLQLPYLRVANVYADELRLDDIQRIGVSEAELQKLLLAPDDLLIVEGNGSEGQIGRAARWDGSITPCVHQNHLIKVRLANRALSPYVLLWLLSPTGRALITRVASSTSGLFTLSISKVASLPVPVPAEPELVRIVREVERVASVARQVGADIEAQLRRAARLRHSILKRAFEGRLVPQDPADEPASVLLERIRAQRAGAERPRCPAARLRRRAQAAD